MELFATDNALEHLPAEMGQLTSLVKLQLSFNNLQSLPAEVSTFIAFTGYAKQWDISQHGSANVEGQEADMCAA